VTADLDSDSPPLLQVVKGAPSPQELAALVTVIASLGTPTSVPTRRTPEWNAPRRLTRVVLRRGVGAWRRSGLPR
jgi:hypothetical protein